MKDKEITLKKSETIKFSELTEREKLLYDAAYNEGWTNGGITIVCVTIGFVLIVASLIFLICPECLN